MLKLTFDRKTRSRLMRFLFLLVLSFATQLNAQVPTEDGLVLWLDVSAKDSFATDEGDSEFAWRDRRGNGLIARSSNAPQVKGEELDGNGVVRFQGNQYLKIKSALKDVSEATAFVVFRRPADLVSGSPWQAVLSDGKGNQGLLLHTGPEVDAREMSVLRGGFQGLDGEDLYLGVAHAGQKGHLWGDIAEILVYRKTFYVEEPIAEITAYLEDKWKFQEDRSTDWTRSGPPSAKPVRTSDTLPLTDQGNQGQWKPFNAMWDEFEGASLDAEKWWDHNPDWYGRAPARYLAREVNVEDGELRISMRKDPELKRESLYPGGNGGDYRDYSSGTIKSKEPTLYGYFEIEARAMASAGSSAWWFTGSSYDNHNDRAVSRIEIDVFELGGKSIGKEKSFNMNAHVFRTADSNRHWNKGGTWKAPYAFADGFHVFGLEWNKDYIRYYVDGALVRSLKNTDRHSPQFMVFDSEIMIDWLGEPKQEDLPSVFSVRYVRAWKNSDTRPEWQKRYTVQGHPARETDITRYVRKMEANNESD